MIGHVKVFPFEHFFNLEKAYDGRLVLCGAAVNNGAQKND